jgi:hypothetical protein
MPSRLQSGGNRSFRPRESCRFSRFGFVSSVSRKFSLRPVEEARTPGVGQRLPAPYFHPERALGTVLASRPHQQIAGGADGERLIAKAR